MARDIFSKELDLIKEVLFAKYNHSISYRETTKSEYTSDEVIEGINEPLINESDINIGDTYAHRRTMLVKSQLFAVYCLRKISSTYKSGTDTKRYSKMAKIIRVWQKKMKDNDNIDFNEGLVELYSEIETLSGCEQLSAGLKQVEKSGHFLRASNIASISPVEIVCSLDSSSFGFGSSRNIKTLSSKFWFCNKFPFSVLASLNNYYYKEVIGVFSEVVELRLSIRIRCLAFNHSIKPFRKALFSDISKSSAENLRLKSTSLDFMLSTILQLNSCIFFLAKKCKLLTERIEALIQRKIGNGRESTTDKAFSDLEYIINIVTSFRDEVDHVLGSKHLIEVNQNLKDNEALISNKTCSDVGAIIMPHQLRHGLICYSQAVPLVLTECDNIRLKLKSIGVLVEDTTT